ncbi:SpoIIE family protein phosphatase [Streptomyces sp. NPDC048215]|uniref:protein-serine/threonine phosphatase n=1 Tax=Streptomyces pratensis (strain ATCC 33331 / IAF-45CD) TaxID=591167 RepID=A0A8D3WL36_STRFA|nr:SpoIIE family protein phosphatase [Streptomyces sp. SID7815]MYT54451.1 SpoIIE family protein phosphatase [Streptomyces sp. SID7815]
MRSEDGLLEIGFMRTVFDSLGAGVLVTDTTGRLTACNPRAAQLLGRPRDQMLGHDLHDLIHRRRDGGTVPRSECGLMAVLDSDVPAEGTDELFLRGDGSLVPVIWAATPLRHEGRSEGAVVVFHDFSLHRDAAEQTAAYLAALEGLTARLTMVAEVSTVLISASDTPQMLHRLAGLLVPDMGDWAAVDLRTSEQTGEMRRVVVRTSGDQRAADELTGLLPPLPESTRSAAIQALRSAEPVVLDAEALAEQPDSQLARAHRDLFERLGGSCAVVVPLHTRRKVFGALTVARVDPAASYTEAEVFVLSDLARRAGLVMEAAELFEQQRHVAETMQRQLLTPLPQVDHLTMAARYRPAESAAEIGGDWYDSFLLSDGVLTMVIGDVVGHDLKAAAHMAEVRNMLRALAWDRTEPPSLIIRRLDEAMTHTSDAPMATCVFARIEGPEGGPRQLRWVNAGHPPPLLVTADGRTSFLEAGHGPLLGLSSALHLGLGWPDARADLPPRSTLLLYTDGLVESRTRDIEAGLDSLRRHASALADRDIEDFLDELLDRIDPSGDDVALLALRVPQTGVGAGDDEAPLQHAHNPAAPGRGAPGSRVEDTPVRDTSEPS